MTDKQNHAIDRIKSSTPARIAVGRAGARPKTETLLAFLGDHAEARDAVKSDLSEQFIQSFVRAHGALLLQSQCENRDNFILFPPQGKRLNPQSSQILQSQLKSNPQYLQNQTVDVCIVISDGLSALAVEENLPDIYPMLVDGFDGAGISHSKAVIVRYGRVAVADQIGQICRAKIALNLIGERPGLSCSRGLSAYITYSPDIEKTISSDRTVVSNIHSGGTPAVEAGAFIVRVVQTILDKKVSGVKLQSLG